MYLIENCVKNLIGKEKGRKVFRRVEIISR